MDGWINTALLATIAAFSGAGTAFGWRIYDKVDKMDRILAAVVQKIGGVRIQ